MRPQERRGKIQQSNKERQIFIFLRHKRYNEKHQGYE